MCIWLKSSCWSTNETNSHTRLSESNWTLPARLIICLQKNVWMSLPCPALRARESENFFDSQSLLYMPSTAVSDCMVFCCRAISRAYWLNICCTVKNNKKRQQYKRTDCGRRNILLIGANVGTRIILNYKCRFILSALHNLCLSCFWSFFSYRKPWRGREGGGGWEWWGWGDLMVVVGGGRTCGWLASFCPLFFLRFIFPEKIKYFCLRKSF